MQKIGKVPSGVQRDKLPAAYLQVVEEFSRRIGCTRSGRYSTSYSSRRPTHGSTESSDTLVVGLVVNLDVRFASRTGRNKVDWVRS